MLCLYMYVCRLDHDKVSVCKMCLLIGDVHKQKFVCIGRGEARHLSIIVGTSEHKVKICSPRLQVS